jgi:predicted ATP-binding protein involved in virulence
MYIQHIHIQNFRGIKEINLPLPATEKKQWIFLTGENGYGKTVFLQALALGLVGGRNYYYWAKYIRKYEAKDAKFDIKSSLKAENRENYVLGYGANRLKIEAFDSKKDWFFSKIYSLFENDAEMFDIGKMLGKRLNERFSEFVKTNSKLDDLIMIKIVDILPHKTKLAVDTSINNTLYKNDLSLEMLTVDKLSVGYQNIIALVGDIIIKLMFSEDNNTNIPQNLNPFDTEAIIFIDEFDAHLHPKWQREFVKKLSETFPNVQFVVATHSPIPILGCPEKPIVLNVKNDKERGIYVERLDEWIDFEKLTPNSIFTSPAFDMENIFSEMSGEVFMSDTYKEVLFRKVLNEKLVEYAEVDKGEKLNKLWKEGVE